MGIGVQPCCCQPKWLVTDYALVNKFIAKDDFVGGIASSSIKFYTQVTCTDVDGFNMKLFGRRSITTGSPPRGLTKLWSCPVAVTPSGTLGGRPQIATTDAGFVDFYEVPWEDPHFYIGVKPRAYPSLEKVIFAVASQLGELTVQTNESPHRLRMVNYDGTGVETLKSVRNVETIDGKRYHRVVNNYVLDHTTGDAYYTVRMNLVSHSPFWQYSTLYKLSGGSETELAVIADTRDGGNSLHEVVGPGDFLEFAQANESVYYVVRDASGTPRREHIYRISGSGGASTLVYTAEPPGSDQLDIKSIQYDHAQQKIWFVLQFNNQTVANSADSELQGLYTMNLDGSGVAKKLSKNQYQPTNVFAAVRLGPGFIKMDEFA